MRKRTGKIWALVMAAVMALSLAGCTGGSGRSNSAEIPESSGGRELVRSAAADDVFSLNSNSDYSLNPLIATNHSNQLVCSLVYENMVEVNDSFEAIPNVIASWECNDDGTQWRMTLDTENPREFHDGTPVTGKDLRYSLERAIVSDRYSGRFSSVWGVSHTDDGLIVTLGVGDSQFIKLLNIPVIKSGTYDEPHPTGSGPYTYNEEGTELLAYSGYPWYDELPVDKVYLKEYKNQDGIISAYEDSVIDIVVNDPSSYTNLGYASTNEIHSFATTNMHYVAFNEETMLGKFPQFRVAMQFAFDREYLVELLNGNAVASAVPMYPGCKCYPSQYANSLRYNLDTCLRILDSVGVRDYDEDGVLEFMSGSPQDFELTFILCSDSSAKAGVVRRFADDMESIGIHVTVKELTWEAYIEALKNGDFDMYYGEVKLRNNFDLTELLQVRKEDENGNAGSNINFTRSTDSNFESYIREYLSAGDTGRAYAYQNLCEYLCSTTGSLITIGFEKQQTISHRGVIKGLEPNMGNPLYNFAGWTIELE